MCHGEMQNMRKSQQYTPMIAVHNSGAELPAAIKVAPATSSLKPSF